MDWETTVFVNGRSLGSHRGGYDPFTFDITGTLKKEDQQEITVSVWDPTDAGWQLRGKQTLHPGGAAYTACSGIWQTVWLEPVPKSSVESLHLVPDVASGTLKVTRQCTDARRNNQGPGHCERRRQDRQLGDGHARVGVDARACARTSPGTRPG